MSFPRGLMFDAGREGNPMASLAPSFSGTAEPGSEGRAFSFQDWEGRQLPAAGGLGLFYLIS